LIFGPEAVWQIAPCGMEHCHGGESNRWVDQSSGLFLHAQLHVTASVFPHNKFGWQVGFMGEKKFKVNNTLYIEKSD
jgi:hypothetical protein